MQIRLPEYGQCGMKDGRQSQTWRTDTQSHESAAKLFGKGGCRTACVDLTHVRFLVVKFSVSESRWEFNICNAVESCAIFVVGVKAGGQTPLPSQQRYAVGEQL